MRIKADEAIERLDEIRRRAAAIIPGPWAWWGNTATDQVYLGTVDRGRIIILDPAVAYEDRVYHHHYEEGYSLEDARSDVKHLCGEHEDCAAAQPAGCRCAEIEEFLRGDMGDGSYYEGERVLENPPLSRVRVPKPDLRFAQRFDHEKGVAEAEDQRRRGGGRLTSYRDLVRYEVLGYRTAVEWEMDQGGVHPSTGTMKDTLYREDFIGIDNPEADFLAAAPGDVAWLLNYIADLEERLGAAGEVAP